MECVKIFSRNCRTNCAAFDRQKCSFRFSSTPQTRQILLQSRVAICIFHFWRCTETLFLSPITPMMQFIKAAIWEMFKCAVCILLQSAWKLSKLVLTMITESHVNSLKRSVHSQIFPPDCTVNYGVLNELSFTFCKFQFAINMDCLLIYIYI